MAHYVIGIDYGSLSARAALVDTADGRVMGVEAFPYPHGIMERALPGGQALPLHWALQHPRDYLDALEALVPRLVAHSGVSRGEVIALGIDMTASSVLPVDDRGEPLCFQPRWEKEPHAYVKMWKHQAAQPQADRMTALARERGEAWLSRYGGIISSTWLHPKLLETLEQAPDLLSASAHYMEGADWLTWLLTGRVSRNACAAGYKALFDGRSYPSPQYAEAVSPAFAREAARLTKGPVLPVGSAAGGLTKAWADRLGLHAGTVVASGMVDAHVGMVASGVTEEGVMHSILGTSGCHLMLGHRLSPVPGICGVVEGGILPGFYGYEAGQVSFGDHLAWLVKEMLPARYAQEARALHVDAHTLLSRYAAGMRPGQSGLLALDWWNGNRSILVDSHLSGLLLGLSLQTQPHEIYRALLEALALSARLIVSNFRDHGLSVLAMSASGGISQKNPLDMQIYADAIGLPVTVPKAEEGAVGSYPGRGRSRRGKRRHEDPGRGAMHGPREAVYRPCREYAPVYDALYEEYKALHDHFGRGEMTMKRLIRRAKRRRPVD